MLQKTDNNRNDNGQTTAGS